MKSSRDEISKSYINHIQPTPSRYSNGERSVSSSALRTFQLHDTVKAGASNSASKPSSHHAPFAGSHTAILPPTKPVYPPLGSRQTLISSYNFLKSGASTPDSSHASKADAPRVQQHSKPKPTSTPTERPQFLPIRPPGYISLGPHNSKSLQRQHTAPPKPHGSLEHDSDDPLSAPTLTRLAAPSRAPLDRNGNASTPRQALPPSRLPNSGRRLVIELKSSPYRLPPQIGPQGQSRPSPLLLKKRGRPFATPEAAARAAAKVARREARARGEPIPRGVALKEVQEEDGTERKRGRKPKVHTEVTALPAIYYPFACEWKGCLAELANLDVLRRHVHVVHGRGMRLESKARVCMWAKCANGMSADAEDGKTVLKVFKDRREWKSHVEEAHLIPFAWHMGDGPRASSLAHHSPASTLTTSLSYLYTSTGTQITPSVFSPPQTIEAGRAKDNNSKRIKKYMRTMHTASLDERPPDVKRLFARMLVTGVSESEMSGVEEEEEEEGDEERNDGERNGEGREMEGEMNGLEAEEEEDEEEDESFKTGTPWQGCEEDDNEATSTLTEDNRAGAVIIRGSVDRVQHNRDEDEDDDDDEHEADSAMDIDEHDASVQLRFY